MGAKTTATRRLARECNDYAAKLVADYPGRFGIFTMLPLPDIDGSLKEIEYGFEKLKADGVYMFTNWGGKALYGDRYLGDPALAWDAVLSADAVARRRPSGDQATPIT